nr:hypothetical protein [Rhizobium sullae]
MRRTDRLVSVTIGGLPITLSAGAGALWRGLLFGWWHARYPGRANAPVAATQIMWDPRLATFCALVGLTAGPQALAALATDGPTILVAGVVVTLVPPIAGLGVGHFLLGSIRLRSLARLPVHTPRIRPCSRRVISRKVLRQHSASRCLMQSAIFF